MHASGLPLCAQPPPHEWAHLLVSDWRLLKRRAWSECSFRSLAASSAPDASTRALAAAGSCESPPNEEGAWPPFCTWRACERRTARLRSPPHAIAAQTVQTEGQPAANAGRGPQAESHHVYRRVHATWHCTRASAPWAPPAPGTRALRGAPTATCRLSDVPPIRWDRSEGRTVRGRDETGTSRQAPTTSLLFFPSLRRSPRTRFHKRRARRASDHKAAELSRSSRNA